MNPFLMWLRGHPAERLVLIIAGVLVVAVTWGVLAHRNAPSSTPSPTPTAAPSTVASTPSPVASATPLTSPPPDVLDAAGSTAKQFLVAITTYRYDDTPTTLGQRVHPYVTEQLYAQMFSRPSDPTFGRHPELHEIDTPQVTKFTSEGYTRDRAIGFLARVSITVQTDQGTSSAPEQAYELFTEQQRDGSWRVSQFTGSVLGVSS